mgnify:CR=1 FL=1
MDLRCSSINRFFSSPTADCATQLGGDFEGPASDGLGESAALNGDGTLVAVAYGSNALGIGVAVLVGAHLVSLEHRKPGSTCSGGWRHLAGRLSEATGSVWLPT